MTQRPPGPALYSERFVGALQAAARMHRAQDRKGTLIDELDRTVSEMERVGRKVVG